MPFAFVIGGLAAIPHVALLLSSRSPPRAAALVLVFLVAALLVAAGGVSVLLFPLLASLEKLVPTPRMIVRAPGPAR